MSEGDESIPTTPRLAEATVTSAPRPLPEILDNLPQSPGVYLMRDRRGKIIYIGKAANLRTRVRQYFQPNTGDTRDFVPLLERVVGDIETVVTGNEKEALLLENTLIKKHQPRFNVKLRDDKSYLVLRLDPASEWPRLEVTRKIKDDGAFHFGPYHSASSCREALRVVNRHFQLRTCTDHVLHNRRRPCLQHQIKRCPAPCVLPVSRDSYGDQVRDVRLFLEGKSEELTDRLQGRMKDAAHRLQFEEAATLRDQLRALESTLQAQRVVSADLLDQDVVGFHREGIAVDIVMLSIRSGKVAGTRTFSFSDQEFPDAEILSSFIGLYYDLVPAPPDEVLLPFVISDIDLKAEWLSEIRAGTHKRRVAVLVPQRGTKRELLDLAQKNAAASFASRRSAEQDAMATLAKLQHRLRLPHLPRVIECYDISHIQGSDTVASMVVFVDARPEKSRYRTFKMRHGGVGRPDDFASMYELLSRRFRRAKDGGGTLGDKPDHPWALPDLIVIDGGKGQLGMALAAARDQDIDIRPGTGLPIIGLAKERDPQGVAATHDPKDRRPDRVFLPNAKEGIPIRQNSAEMYVLAHLRDEAHRFAVTFHRAQRKRRTLRSALGDIAGIGQARQRALLRHFGSLRKLRDATLDEIAGVQGVSMTAAQAVHTWLQGHGDSIGLTALVTPDVSPPDDVVQAEGAQDAIESAFADLADIPGDSDDPDESDPE